MSTVVELTYSVFVVTIPSEVVVIAVDITVAVVVWDFEGVLETISIWTDVQVILW